MSTGYSNKTNNDGIIHCANYDDEGRHSIDYDPVTGDVTHDHTVSNDDQDYKEQWSDSNFGNDLDKDYSAVEGVEDNSSSYNQSNEGKYYFMGIPSYYRATLTALLSLLGTLYASAYDSKDLVGSALEYEIDPRDFMMYFQDGNILSIILGLVCGTLLFIFRKHLNHKIKTALIAFITTIVAASILLMIFGEGYVGMVSLIALSVLCVIGLFIFIILPGLLILWAYKSLKSKEVVQSSKEVWSLLINGFGTMPLAIVLALFAFRGSYQIARTWNLKQCEKYIQSRWNKDFYKVPELMLRWEAEHTLQWGEKAKRIKEKYDENYNIDFVDIEQKVK